MPDIKKLLRKSSLSKKVGNSITVVSVCFRIIKKRYAVEECDGYIRHNILSVKWLPREVGIRIYRDKGQLLEEINKELIEYGLKYVLKDILTK